MTEEITVHKQMPSSMGNAICGAYSVPYQRMFWKEVWKPLTCHWKRVNCQRCLAMIKEPVMTVMWRTR